MADGDQHEAHPEEITLLDYVVGELGPDSSDAIRRHVETCVSCRERIVGLAMDVDEIDRLPMVGIPHDLLLGALSPEHTLAGRRRTARRTAPVLLLLAAAIGVIALFQLGGMGASSETVAQRQVVLQTASGDPVRVVDSLMGDVPHRVVIDRADDRHLVVLVGDADVAVAYARLSEVTATSGQSYVIDIGGTGRMPDTTG
ncbi:MAG: zf-HC2 domain-containing protein [Thermoleophilia bacterium]